MLEDSSPFHKLRNRVLRMEIDTLNSGWEDVLVPFGLARAGVVLEDADMTRRAGEWSDFHMQAGFKEGYPHEITNRMQLSGVKHSGFYLTPYCGEWGAAMVLAVQEMAEPGNAGRREAISRFADHIIDGSIRWSDGTICHGDWSKIPWVDTLYYSAAPLAWAYAVTGTVRYAEEAVQQCLLHARHLRDDASGCFFHEAHLDGQRTPWLWSRGNGWVIMAFADVLRWCPPSTPGWKDALKIYRDLVVGLLRFQHACGFWRIVPENSESHLETTGSVMIASGMAVGLGQGWLDPSVDASVSRVLRELESWIGEDGTLYGCQTPAGLGGWERHKKSLMGERTYGLGATLRLFAEVREAKSLRGGH